MPNQATQTAFGPMVAAAIEAYYPPGQRLLHDDLAIRFIPPSFQWFIKLTRWAPARQVFFNLSERRARGVWGGVLCRKRYIDDRLRQDLEAGCRGVINLGAGLDTRAYRLALPAGIPAFEVDLPENIAYKEAQLRRVYGSVPPGVTLVPLDFDRQELESLQSLPGYPSAEKCFFVLEAVTQYLGEASVRKVFSFLAKAAAGSRLAFTYIRQDFIDGTARYEAEALYQAFRVKEQFWRFGMYPSAVADFLAAYGWQELEQMGSVAYQERYIQPIGRSLPVTEMERMVYAGKL
jgi:methyltransferase (TIGR00027 family)